MSSFKSLKFVKSLLLFLPLCPMALQAEISQQPLYLQTRVQPNIFFLVDDSGSMDWEVLKSNGANAISAYDSYRDSGIQEWWPDSSSSYRYSVLEACAGYNVLYYDPSVTYVPWAGEDRDGNTYANQSITAARLNPYDSRDGFVNLYAADRYGYYDGYYTWTDDGDGVLERGECPDASLRSYNYSSQFVSPNPNAGAQVMSSSEQTNFANWYTYYRKREYVVKAALSGIVNSATERMGLATINNNSGSAAVADMTDSATKTDLLNLISRIDSSGGTPLRSSLKTVGEYFKRKSGGPILDLEHGGACQQNFAILMSDGYWNSSSPSGIGNADGDNNSDFDGGSYADNAGKTTLADVAMHYYENDLRTDLPNEVPTSPLDNNDQQHMVTYTVAFGVNGTLDENPSDTTTPFSWPTPVSNQDTTIDDLRHAAWNGRGDFLSASSPTGLITALNNAIKSIDSRVSSSSAVAANSTRLDTDTKIFQARFSSGSWSGDLWAYDLDPDTGAVGSLAWSAADLMPAESSRNIFTSTGSVDLGVEFEYANLTSPQKSTITSDEVAYIRGDRSNEGTTYRSRVSILGDIINSDPIYSGKDNYNYYSLEMSGTVSTYNAYLTGTTSTWQKGNRIDVLYVGANDGMLHAFSGDGEELFAYIPKSLVSSLSDLTDSAYEHRYYVDGTASNGDAFIDFDDSGSERWGTALIGVLGGGGKGVFALDISDPLNFDDEDVLWDLDEADLVDLGYTYSQPSIVKLANGDWGAVFGNGYGSASHEAVLYIVNLETGAVIKEFHTESMGDSVDTNGLSTPIVVDTNGDSVADAVYAGDLKGNMWAFDISGSTVDSWDIKYYTGTTPKPLFTACTDDPCTDPQPITSKPQAIEADDGSLIVLFGTGKYFETGDNYDLSQDQSYYGVQDDDAVVDGRDELVEQTIIAEYSSSATGLSYNTRLTSDNDVDLATKDGWYMDFNSSDYPGERIVSSSLVRSGRVIFPTLVPEADACSSGGTSWLMELDADTGARLASSPYDMNGDGVIDDNDLVGIDTDNDGVADTYIAASGKESTVGIIKTPGVISTGDDEKKYTSGSSGDIEVTTESSDNTSGRQSWEQLK
ncbi:pilus assembly protein [Amphritea opalescens]|uniref:Pilus assembly protein n=1 Tax=Amphritea opalescens TaxID=2490544 RepID=A0A430KLL0_9GAMM|nr:PilC/PilY family type IV pilus protein [Amphritea opalescens]RTE64361.1 pilus assembly protein [Amphritea opalescens]